MKTLRNRLIFGFVLLLAVTAAFTVMQQNKPDDIHLVLNIPASRIDVFENGKKVRSIAVSAGMREHATPRGRYHISSVIWNPWWHPPKSAWARGEKPTPPGPDNPMGRVKINFAPLYYIHGTPYESRLGAPASHGCIRMGQEDLFWLAERIHQHRTPRVSSQTLATLRDNPRMTRQFNIKPIRFDVVYRLVEVVDGELVIHPDVYRSGEGSLRDEIVDELKKEGFAITSEVEQRIAQISKRRNATRLEVPLEELVSSEGD